MNYFKITPGQVYDYKRDGYIIVRNFLSQNEIKKLSGIALSDASVRKHAIDLNDQSGKKTKLTSWYTPGNDAYGLLTKSKRIVGSVNQLLEGESPVCHFHSKLMQKEPRVGGAWEWHQDYGYWYKNEFLFPEQMISVMIAITDANKENGCLQVIKGSHKMGRIEHGFSGEQVGALQHYVDLALKTMELVYVELKAGDALFFHSNIRSFLKGAEKVYPGLASNIKADPGKNRLLLTWIHNSDPGITKYIVYWNNGADSVIVDAATKQASDTVKAYINSLEEGNHNFVIHSFYASGEKSVPINIENIPVYGNKYSEGLLNRSVSAISYTDNKVTINWNIPDTINITTEVRYTTSLDEVKTVYVDPDSNTLVLSDWKLPTRIYYRSSYKPQANAIDTFVVNVFDSLSIPNLPVDKSLWKEALLPNDVIAGSTETPLSYIWDGQVGSYPDIYQTDAVSIPHTFTIDLGKSYGKLSRFEEWGRPDITGPDNGNPVELEIWGIEDTTGSATLLPATDPEWKNESILKGWTLLTEVKRTDDGVAGVTTNIVSNPPAVRYIRIRVVKTASETAFSHLSEISLWYDQ